jgi:hypothetical protein
MGRDSDLVPLALARVMIETLEAEVSARGLPPMVAPRAALLALLELARHQMEPSALAEWLRNVADMTEQPHFADLLGDGLPEMFRRPPREGDGFRS